MSDSRIARNVRGSNGRNFPPGHRETDETVLGIVTRLYGAKPHGRKTLAQVANSNERTSGNWLEGKNGMSLHHFVSAFRSDPAFASAALRELLQHETDLDPMLAHKLNDLVNAAMRMRR